jgi:thiamine-phosphate pyrophosphorylase
MTDAPTTRLMLVTPEVADAAAFLPALQAALGGGDIAAVVIRLAEADDRTRLGCAKSLVAAAQSAGAAALLSGNGVEDIVGKSGADGVHVSAEESGLADAIERFKPEKIVGCSAPRSRDAAMSAGEAGADYVLFGDLTGERPFQETLERVEWWVPIFELPCVGLAAEIGDVAALAAADAEFAALADAVWRHPQGPAAAVAAAGAALSMAQAPTP